MRDDIAGTEHNGASREAAPAEQAATENTAPNATSDSVTGTIGDTFTIDVLANDTDAESDPLTITQINFQDIRPGLTLNFSDGAFTLNQDGTLTFVSTVEDQGQNEFSNFNYTVSDENNTNTTSVRFELDPANFRPDPQSDRIEGIIGDTFTIDVLRLPRLPGKLRRLS